MSEEQRSWDWHFYGKWVAANAIGELIGLGITGLIGAGIGLIAERALGGFAGALMFIVLVVLGTFEGTVVGYAQWRVLRQKLPELPLRSWLWITALGAFMAWVLGMLPSTLMDMSAGGEPAPEVSDAMVYLLAAGMGFVAGPILGGPQFIILRRYVNSAGWWILANALAWMVGMPIVFIGASNGPEGGFTIGFVMLILLTVTGAGAAVGAVHGLFMTGFRRREEMLN